MTNGKGSARRPRAITSAEEADRWHRTFGTVRRAVMRQIENAPNLAHYNPSEFIDQNLDGVDKRDGSGVD